MTKARFKIVLVEMERRHQILGTLLSYNLWYFWDRRSLNKGIEKNSQVSVSLGRSFRVQLFATLWTPPRLLCPWNFPGKNIRASCISNSRESSTQGLNPHLCVSWLVGRFFTTLPPGKPRFQFGTGYLDILEKVIH